MDCDGVLVESVLTGSREVTLDVKAPLRIYSPQGLARCVPACSSRVLSTVR